MTDELYTDGFKKLNTKTKTAYEHHYNRLMNLTNNRNVLDFKDDVKELINILRKTDIPPSSKKSILNVISIILNTKEKPIKLISDYREELEAKHYENKKESNKDLINELPTLAVLNTFLDDLLTRQMYREYIMNYLIIKFGVRNMDLDVIITDDKSKVNKVDNFLLITKTYISFIVNKYKTRDVYGSKKMKVEVKPFINAVIKLHDECGDEVCKLLVNSDGNEVKDKNKFIQQRTYNKLGEGKIFKALVKDYVSRGKIEKTKVYGKTRGTDMETILADYYVEE